VTGGVGVPRLVLLMTVSHFTPTAPSVIRVGVDVLVFFDTLFCTAVGVSPLVQLERKAIEMNARAMIFIVYMINK
jgi:hypothetical protein